MSKTKKTSSKPLPVEIRAVVADLRGETVKGNRVGTIPYNAIGNGVVAGDFVEGHLSSDSKEHVVVVVTSEHKIYVALEEQVVEIKE